MRLICDVCWPPGGDGDVVSFSRYQDWTLHLLSAGHEQEMRANLMERVRRTEDDKGYVVTFTKSRQGTLPNRLQLLEYFGTSGCLAQYYYDETARFCFIRVDSMFDGCEPLREGQYMINDVHLVNCLKVKDTSDTYWRCLLQRKAPKQPVVPLPSPETSGYGGPLNGLLTVAPVQDNGDGDKEIAALAAPTEQLTNTKATTNKKKQRNMNSPCLFDTRQMLGNNQFSGTPNSARSPNVDSMNGKQSPVTFTDARPNHQLQQMMASSENYNNNMHRAQYPAPVGYYPAHLGGQMIPPYPNPPQIQQQHQSSQFYVPHPHPPIPNQQQYQQYDNYYRPMYPMPSPPFPNAHIPQTTQQQVQAMPMNNVNNSNFKVMPQNGRNSTATPTMHHPQFMHQTAPAFLSTPPPPPGFRALQTVDPKETGDGGKKKEEKTKQNPLDVSFMSGTGDDEFLRKIQMAFGTAALGQLGTSIPSPVEQKQLIKPNVDHLLLPPDSP